ncbi:MAG TPA: HAMP domain-containing sensor histidine kinase [Oscillatoriaceae cyanobacterium]
MSLRLPARHADLNILPFEAGTVDERTNAEQARHSQACLSVASHELRTPLTFILGFGSLLEDEQLGTLSAEQRHCVQGIMEGGARLERLVDKLLELATIHSGQLVLRREPVDYAFLLQQLVQEHAPAAKARGIVLELQVRPLVMPNWDARHVCRVLDLLLENALEHTPTGGRITLEARQRGRAITTLVRDSGTGIAADDIGKLFKPFGQLDLGSTRKAKGMGLGLAIAKALVDAHGGTIGVESTPGCGSAFGFRMPTA